MPAPSPRHFAWELVPPPGCVIQHTQLAGGGGQTVPMIVCEVIGEKGKEWEALAWLAQEIIRIKHNLQSEQHTKATGEPNVVVGGWGTLTRIEKKP